MNNVYIPYTYLIKWSTTGMKYYGVKYEKGCNPDQFWKTYFTSSKYVDAYRVEHGDPDIIQIRRTFTEGRAAREWESRVLKTLKVTTRSDFLNKNDGQLRVNWEDPEICKKHRDSLKRACNTPQARKRNSEAQKIAQNKPEVKSAKSARSLERWESNEYREKLSKIHRENWKNDHYRKVQSTARKEAALRPEVRMANSKRNTGSGNARYDHTIYRWIHTSGTTETCTRYDLMKKYNISLGIGISQVIRGKRRSAYGWRLLN